jgi:hypothetical protein
VAQRRRYSYPTEIRPVQLLLARPLRENFTHKLRKGAMEAMAKSVDPKERKRLYKEFLKHRGILRDDNDGISSN